jgi:hypothetical protein
MVISISVRREEQGTLNIDGAEHRSRVYINEQVEALWNVDKFTFLRLQIVAPGLCL